MDYHCRCVTDFLESLQKDADYLKGVLSCPLEMHLTEEEEELCQTAEECHICEEKISPDQTYHRDHNHLTGVSLFHFLSYYYYYYYFSILIGKLHQLYHL